MSSNLYGAPQAIQHPQQITYICGSCGVDNEIRPKEPIRCRECGNRILYKKRTKRMVQFEAR
ncbi:hypothetical protein H8356DRAFT_1279443 [Neocallimastix lanati (nom. inval.)]|uniref:Uncharacterized protein n=1 Tax=Neocallimastix californiae TaxID=1754190 RepID=A0A1Y2AIV5_9FUNG|nr:hypothetical protein H8356DRAFT_1279443 [Neocallimastix sp. JGI-2020a]ORY21865.1 hypothetical protein LY90DRAFT_707306 [Neocallimastix californiae]|eukprot:ORY21865.1 hypothetical protein LY90DRAFT_707306 [Neocallimastix californiae]